MAGAAPRGYSGARSSVPSGGKHAQDAGARGSAWADYRGRMHPRYQRDPAAGSKWGKAPVSSIERMHAAVLGHRICWDDLTARVARNEKIPPEQAGALVEKLYDKHSVCLAVAVAIIDLIVEAERGSS